MNDDLRGGNAYDKLDHSSVMTWVKIRNSAAHGKSEEFTKEQVGLMLQGIQDFLVRHPA
jgi:hypothetical protein